MRYKGMCIVITTVPYNLKHGILSIREKRQVFLVMDIRISVKNQNDNSLIFVLLFFSVFN